MAEKSGSARVKAKVANKSALAALPKPRVKKARMSKLEAERLVKFKALMAKCAEKLSFAVFDE